MSVTLGHHTEVEVATVLGCISTYRSSTENGSPYAIRGDEATMRGCLLRNSPDGSLSPGALPDLFQDRYLPMLVRRLLIQHCLEMKLSFDDLRGDHRLGRRDTSAPIVFGDGI